MAKSARSSVIKRNHAKLRATVFGPANDARIERLSAKLQEIAAQPRPERQEETHEEEDSSGIGMQIFGHEAREEGVRSRVKNVNKPSSC